MLTDFNEFRMAQLSFSIVPFQYQSVGLSHIKATTLPCSELWTLGLVSKFMYFCPLVHL